MSARCASLHFMKLCCKTSFQQTHDKLLFTSSISNGHAHSSEKASEQASLLSCEYLFGTLLAQKRMTRRKGLHLMPLLPCYSQSCQSLRKANAILLSYVALCLLGLKLWDIWSHSACKISSKNDDHLSPRINP